MLALHVIACEAVVLLIAEEPNCTGDVQLIGKLTGDPKAYNVPCVVPM